MNADNMDQADFWTQDAGRKWVAQQAALDALFEPVLSGVLDRAGLCAGDTVLDIGCGTGASTLEAAIAVGPSGSVLGVDISPTMLIRARERSSAVAKVEYLSADVAEHPFEKGRFNQLISRFGVMFFTDPVAAFSNMARGLSPDAKVSFVTWGQIPDNPWFTCAAQAAKAQLGAPPSVDPDAPGPFSMRDKDGVIRLLAEAGFDRISAETVDLHLTPDGAAADVAALAVSIGPAARTLSHFQGNDADLAAITEKLQAAFEAFETPQGLRIPAQVNFFEAQRKAA